MKTLGIPAEVTDMKDYDPDDQLADEVSHVQRERTFSFDYGAKIQLCVETYDPKLLLEQEPKPVQS